MCASFFLLPFTTCLSVLLNSSQKALNFLGCCWNSVGLCVPFPDRSQKTLLTSEGARERGALLRNQARSFLFLSDSSPKAWKPPFSLVCPPPPLDSAALFSVSRWMFLSFLFN